MIADKDYCCSSFLVFRDIVGGRVFSPNIPINHYSRYGHGTPCVDVHDCYDVERHIKNTLSTHEGKKIGLLLSGGMDSGLLASYLKGCDAYTFRFMNGEYAPQETKGAEYFSSLNDLKLHYVDISWDSVIGCVDKLMDSKGAPVHSIEPQVYIAAEQAKKDGIDLMIIGDGADYVFGGMDQLLSKDWMFEDFVKRYTYLDPSLVLSKPVSMHPIFEQYRIDSKYIDFMTIMFNTLCPDESYESYANAFHVSQLEYCDPYADMHLASPIDLKRIRSGESKYIIRELFKKRYGFDPPNKTPMPRPVDNYFENWSGPSRDEFLKNLDINSFTGNQKWQIWCLERFLNNYF